MDKKLSELLYGNAPRQAPEPAHSKSEAEPLSDSNTVEELLEEATPKAIRELFKIGMDEDVSPGVRVNALTHILDRKLGKPTQATTLEITGEYIIQQMEAARGKLIDVTPGKDDDDDG